MGYCPWGHTDLDLASPSTHVPNFLVSVSAFWNGNPNSTESPQLVFVNEKYCVPSVKEKKKKKGAAAIKPSCYSHPCGKP